MPSIADMWMLHVYRPWDKLLEFGRADAVEQHLEAGRLTLTVLLRDDSTRAFRHPGTRPSPCVGFTNFRSFTASSSGQVWAFPTGVDSCLSTASVLTLPPAPPLLFLSATAHRAC